MKNFKSKILPWLVVAAVAILVIIAFDFGQQLYDWSGTYVKDMTVGELILVVWFCGLLSR